jgi:hypothetical protein
MSNKHETQQSYGLEAVSRDVEDHRGEGSKIRGMHDGKEGGTYNGTAMLSGLCIIMSGRKGRVLSAQRAVSICNGYAAGGDVEARSRGVGDRN